MRARHPALILASWRPCCSRKDCRLGLLAGDVTVIGDNARTDALGAARLGMAYLLVGDAPHADAPDMARLLAAARPRRHALPEGIAADGDQ